MPFPQLFGDLGALATRGMKLPGVKVNARTPPFMPSNAGAGTALPPVPDGSEPSSDDSQAGSGIGSNPPISPTLRQPPMTPGMRQEQILLDNPPAAAGGVRGKIGGVLNAIGWNWAGNPLKYPGLDTYQANLARAQAKAGIEDEATKRQEAQARIANMQANTQAMTDYRQQAGQDRQQNTYDRRMGEINKAGGFEAPNVPPTADMQDVPADPNQPPSPTNLPQRNLILSPGLQPKQSSSLGTVQNLTDPSTGTTTPMVTPNLKTRAEMQRVDAPQDILDFYKNLPQEFTKTYPVGMPNIGPDGKVAPEEAKRLEAKYQRDSAALQAWNAQRTKPEKLDQVGLAIKAVGGDPNNPASVTPEIAAKAVAKLKQQQPGTQLTPEAVQYWAQYAATTGQLPSLGMGGAGAAARGQILNAAPALSGGGNVAGNKATYRADSGSLAQAQKMRDSVVAFEKTASKNLDLFTNQAQKVIDSGSPWINQPLRTINRNGLGNADQAAFDAARQVALTEIAKVVNNPSLSSVLSDTARREVLALNPENATLKQITAVAGILKQDMANRRTSLDQQITDIKSRMNPSATPAGGSANPNPNGYVAGHVYGGLTYLGGDPNNQASWRK